MASLDRTTLEWSKSNGGNETLGYNGWER